nr:hypothetical protein [Tanacetum cinerariifolium]
MLLYAGILQLVASILASMFQGDLSKGKAKVAWKQICRPKNEGDGKSIFLWHDRWWDEGILSEIFPTENLPNAHSRTKINEMIQNDVWIWLEEWVTVYPNFLTIPTPNQSDVADKTCWMTNDE